MDASRIVPEFALAVINSNYGQTYFRSKAKRTTNLASINGKEVSGFPLPQPSPGEQQDLIDELSRERRMAEEMRRQATAARAAAWKDFETAIYAAEDGTEAIT